MPHRNLKARPDTLLKAMAPWRDDRVIAVACLFPWYWLADLGAQAGLPLVLGHALSRQAIPGGKTTNDTIDSQQSAVLLRGGLPAGLRLSSRQAGDPCPARRRTPGMRQRAEVLAHIHHTTRPYHLPEMGKQSASKRTATGSPSGCPLPRCQRASQATARCWATTTSGAAPWTVHPPNGPAHQASRCTSCVPSPGAARS